MKDQLHKEYGKLSAGDIRILLSMLEALEIEAEVLTQDILSNPRKRDKVFSLDEVQNVWAGYYELDFPTCVAAFMVQFGIDEELRHVSQSENQIQSLAEWVKSLDQDDFDDDDITQAQWVKITRYVYALNTVLIKNLHSLMVYGVYINDLVKIAREGKPEKRDKALLAAIKIDPTVVGCATGIQRISRAVLMRDDKFLSSLQLAIEGKLGAKEDATYKKMRFVLQVLHEAKAQQLSDNQLMVLFVKQLNLYLAPNSAEKNLGEFARNFRKKKSTI